MRRKDQNACLLTTAIDEETGKTILTYIPIHVYPSIVELFLEHGECNNNRAVYFELDTDGKTFWEDMWKELEE